MPQWLKVWGILFYSFTFVYLFICPHLGHMFFQLNPSYSFKARTFYFTNYLYMFLFIVYCSYQMFEFFFTSGVIFFSYLTEFSYYSVKKNPKITRQLEQVKNDSFLKGGVDDFSYFHWFSVVLFSIQNHSLLLKWVCLMMFNTTFNNISAISWRSVLLMEETRVPRENHWSVTSQWQSLSHNVVSSSPRHQRDLNSQHQRWKVLIA